MISVWKGMEREIGETFLKIKLIESEKAFLF